MVSPLVGLSAMTQQILFWARAKFYKDLKICSFVYISLQNALWYAMSSYHHQSLACEKLEVTFSLQMFATNLIV